MGKQDGFSPGEASLYVMKRLFTIMTGSFAVTESLFSAVAAYSGVFFGNDEADILSAGYDRRKTAPYVRSLHGVLDTYGALQDRIGEAIGLSDESATAVLSGEPIPPGTSERLARDIAMIRAWRAMLERRIAEAKTRFRNIVESEGRSAVFLAKRVARLEELSRRDERIMIWLRRKYREWQEGEIPAVQSFREADDFLRESESAAEMVRFHEVHVPFAATETDAQIGRVKKMLLFPTVKERLGGDPATAENVRARLEDATVRMVLALERARLLGTYPETFREIMAIRESVGIALERMLPR